MGQITTSIASTAVIGETATLPSTLCSRPPTTAADDSRRPLCQSPARCEGASPRPPPSGGPWIKPGCVNCGSDIGAANAVAVIFSSSSYLPHLLRPRHRCALAATALATATALALATAHATAAIRSPPPPILSASPASPLLSTSSPPASPPPPPSANQPTTTADDDSRRRQPTTTADDRGPRDMIRMSTRAKCCEC